MCIHPIETLILPDFLGVVPSEILLNAFKSVQGDLWPIRGLPLAKPFQILWVGPTRRVAKGIIIPAVGIDVEAVHFQVDGFDIKCLGTSSNEFVDGCVDAARRVGEALPEQSFEMVSPLLRQTVLKECGRAADLRLAEATSD